MLIRKKLILLFMSDMTIVWLSVLASYLFRFGWGMQRFFEQQMFGYAIFSTGFIGVCMVFYRMYHSLWQYAGTREIIAIIKAVVMGWLAANLLTGFVYGERIPISVSLLSMESILLLMGGSRFLWRLVRRRKVTANGDKTNVLIFGAGDCGALIAKELMTSVMASVHPVGFIDDNPRKHHLSILGLPVFGNRDQIAHLVASKDIKEIIIAIPSAPKEEISAIINVCKMARAHIKIIPGLHDLINGKVSVQAIREVEIEDLLGREPVEIDLSSTANCVHQKIVLVTGAGGSIGSELCRQIAVFQPGKLLLLGHGENSIYLIENELRDKYPAMPVETLIADIQDRSSMERIFNEFKPAIVFHAAAHKHVPLMERNPSEAVRNNVFGTKNVSDCAKKYGAERFVLISSDKAVNPTSIMGATKRIAEMYIQSLATNSKTIFAAVRFGNVLGSRGSVIPRFKEQIKAGGPVTVTHPEMTRYFMTIPEAVQLVLQAGSFANGGEVFVLDMGQPVNILGLAEDLIRLSGFEPYTEVPIVITGIRKGEKLHEELLSREEIVSATRNDRIFVGKPCDISRTKLNLEFQRLEIILSNNHAGLKDVIERLVPDYGHVS